MILHDSITIKMLFQCFFTDTCPREKTHFSYYPTDWVVEMFLVRFRLFYWWDSFIWFHFGIKYFSFFMFCSNRSSLSSLFRTLRLTSHDLFADDGARPCDTSCCDKGSGGKGTPKPASKTNGASGASSQKLWYFLYVVCGIVGLL